MNDFQIRPQNAPSRQVVVNRSAGVLFGENAMPKGVYERKIMPFQERFWADVAISGSGDCWEWQGLKDTNGYGRFWALGAYTKAHRVAYWLCHGTPPPPWMDVCHVCDNPSCTNPTHLFLGTRSDNMRDCVSKGRHSETKKTHCPRGHEYTADNTKRGRTKRHDGDDSPRRQCRICNKAWNDAYYRRKQDDPNTKEITNGQH